MSLLDAKMQIGKACAELVQEGMIVGLGTGSTAEAFIYALAKRDQATPLNITCVCTSSYTEELARRLQLSCVSIDSIDYIDITFDGADEVDSKKRLIKGAGGALLREKIVARASRELTIMVEE